MALPPRLMKAKLGMEFAKPTGRIKCVQADADGRCWGAFMHVRADILCKTISFREPAQPSRGGLSHYI